MIQHISTQALGYGEVCTGVAVFHYTARCNSSQPCTRAFQGSQSTLDATAALLPAQDAQRTADVSLDTSELSIIRWRSWHRSEAWPCPVAVVELGMESTSPNCFVLYLTSRGHPGREKAQGK